MTDDSYMMCLQGSEAFQTEKVQATTLLPKKKTKVTLNDSLQGHHTVYHSKL
jgi:hypothetical protein